ncbi:hypothetical protein O181_117845 [Austropuccinia psidii MF-1]|uniref:Uncharacterized protein n=1 Tax=Austropuccinia psidii MF-1 TaxID=1389203 RepID=A0A9Q3KB48_9BASI|nr:hypothetical protein [Austropuccinia psidii MF-1]
MANLTPNSQLSSYERLNRLLSENQEDHEDVHSNQVSPNLTTEIMEEPLSGQILGKMNFEALPSQTSTQRRKRRMSEEAQLYWQKLEHKCMLKRQRRENNHVNAEAQRLKQVEQCLAQETNERNCKSRFFWNGDSTRQLLEMMRDLHIKFVNMDETMSVFIPWSHFFKTNENHKHEFQLLKDLSCKTLERQYKALMAIYKIIKDFCDATGGGGLYIQLQRHHMTMEVFELLKEINLHSCGTNEVGFKSGNFQTPANNNDGDFNHEDVAELRQLLCEQGGHSGSDNGNSGPREGVEDWADDSTNIQSQAEGSQTTRNVPGTSGTSHRNSVSQASSVSRGTTHRNWNLMNNMNTNMQNMLSPLMLMLQQSQDHTEERYWMQRLRDEERQMLMREQEEEQRLQESQIRAEEQRRNDQLNMYMMARLSKMTGVPLDDPPSGLHLGE